MWVRVKGGDMGDIEPEYKDPILYEGAKDEPGWQDEKGEDETYEKKVKIIST